MAVLSLIALLFLVIAVVIVIKFIKHLLLAAILVLSLLTIVLVGMGLLVYVDTQNFSKAMSNDPILVLLAAGGNSSTLYAAAQLQPAIEGTSRNYSALYASQLFLLQRQYAIEQFSEMQGTNSKIIIITVQAIEQLDLDPVVVEGRTFTKPDILRLVNAPDAQAVLADLLVANSQASSSAVRSTLEQRGMTSERIKADVLMLCMQQLFMEKNYPFLIEKVKQKEIIIYPETPLVTVMKVTPSSLFLKLTKTVGGSTSS